MPRIIIADPDPYSRNALFLWLIYKSGVDEIVKVKDGDTLGRMISELPPALVLMDWSLPGRPDASACARYRDLYGTRWIILSVDDSVAEAARSCSPWFIRKGSSPDEILDLIRTALPCES